MNLRRLPWVFLAVMLIARCVTAAGLQPALLEFEARIAALRAQIPAVAAAADHAAGHILEQPDALLLTPYTEATGLGDELTNRAGGLAIALPSHGRRDQPQHRDVVLVSVRAWQTDGPAMIQMVRSYRDKGWPVALIASAAERPDDLEVDHFIDNGAPSGDGEHGRINVLANTTLAWMWCGEYVAAMTRRGKYPGILISVGLPGGVEHDRPLQTPQGRRWVGDTAVAIPAGDLARLYLARVETLLADLKSAPRQAQIQHAADLLAQRVRQGRALAFAGVGHLIVAEAHQDNRGPWRGFNYVQVLRGALARECQPSDALVWIGYSGGINSSYHNFAAPIRDAGMELITCYTPDPRRDEPDLGGLTPLAHIDQSWAIGDAEVPLHVPPGRMAPISGLNGVLIQRMLDDEVVRRLSANDAP